MIENEENSIETTRERLDHLNFNKTFNVCVKITRGDGIRKNQNKQTNRRRKKKGA